MFEGSNCMRLSAFVCNIDPQVPWKRRPRSGYFWILRLRKPRAWPIHLSLPLLPGSLPWSLLCIQGTFSGTAETAAIPLPRHASSGNALQGTEQCVLQCSRQGLIIGPSDVKQSRCSPKTEGMNDLCTCTRQNTTQRRQRATAAHAVAGSQCAEHTLDVEGFIRMKFTSRRNYSWAENA